MDAIFSKVGLFFAALLASISSPAFIYLEKTQIDLNWNMGDTSPLISQISLKNTGDRSMRFTLSSSNTWTAAFREGQPGVTSFNIFAGGALDIIIEVYPSELNDGKHQAFITVNAVNDLDGIVQETQTVIVTVNKNYTEEGPSTSPNSLTSNTPTPSNAEPTEYPQEGPSIAPEITNNPNIAQSPKVSSQDLIGPSNSIQKGDSLRDEEGNKLHSEKNVIKRFFDKVLSWFGFGD